jgi:hypothetical protein
MSHNSCISILTIILAQHFIFIADAMTYMSGDNEQSLWSEEDGMYYDVIQFAPGNSIQLPVRSLVGLIPLYATLVLEPAVLNRFPGFKKRVEWFIDNRPEVSARNMANMKGDNFSSSFTLSRSEHLVAGGRGERRLLALASKERLVRILEKMLDENEFLSEYGIRSYARYLITLRFLLIPRYEGYLSCTRISPGGCTSTDSGMKLATGLVIRTQGCSAGTLTGEGQFVRSQ